MSAPFTLDHLKQFETHLKNPAQVRLLHYLAKECALLREDGPLTPENQVRMEVDLLDLARAIDVYEPPAILKISRSIWDGSPYNPTQDVKDKAARRRVWDTVRSGEKFAQFNQPEGEPTGRFAMVWFWLSSTLPYRTAQPPKPENMTDMTIGINADFVDAMIEYGHQLKVKDPPKKSRNWDYCPCNRQVTGVHGQNTGRMKKSLRKARCWRCEEFKKLRGIYPTPYESGTTA